MYVCMYSRVDTLCFFRFFFPFLCLVLCVKSLSSGLPLPTTAPPWPTNACHPVRQRADDAAAACAAWACPWAAGLAVLGRLQMLADAAPLLKRLLGPGTLAGSASCIGAHTALGRGLWEMVRLGRRPHKGHVCTLESTQVALYGSCVHVWRAGQQGRFREMGCGAPVYAPQVLSSLHQPARRGPLLAIRWPFAESLPLQLRHHVPLRARQVKLSSRPPAVISPGPAPPELLQRRSCL